MEHQGDDPGILHDPLVQVIVVAGVGQGILAEAVSGGIVGAVVVEGAQGAVEARKVHIGAQPDLAHIEVEIACVIHGGEGGGVVFLHFHIQAVVI